MVSVSRLGGSARRGAKGDADALGHERLQDRVDEGGLADARAAGDHQGLARHRQPQRLPLALRERDAALRLEPGYRLVDVDGGPGRRAGGKGAQMPGDVLLGPVQARQEDAASIPDGVGHHGPVLQLEGQRGREPVGRHLQQLGSGAQEIVLRQAAVTLVHGFGQGIADAGADPDHGVFRDADLGRDLIGGLEADAADVAREPVGVLADDRDRLGPVGLVDPHRPRRPDAVRMQEQHDLADDLLLGPARGDALGALRPDALDLAEATGLLLDDVEHRLSKGLHEALGVGWTDAADHAGTEVAFDAVEGRRWGHLEEGGAELQAVGAVVVPRSGGLDELAGRDHGSVPGDRDEVALAAGLQAQDAEAVLLVVEGHALDEAGEVLGRGLGLRACRRNVHDAAWHAHRGEEERLNRNLLGRAKAHVRTLHPELHLDRGPRLPERLRRGEEPAAALQYRPDDDDRRRETRC